MTKEDKIKAYAMTLDGYTYQAIANEFGVTNNILVVCMGANYIIQNYMMK